jgi:sugar lactone lactonase YvrE
VSGARWDSLGWETVATGLKFPEAPRWHNGRLYFSEIFGGRVLALDERGSVEVVVELPGRPSGLGWRPDGTMLVVSMQDQRVLRAVDGGLLEEVADLSALVDGDTNDMLVDQLGAARVVADDVWVPNGMAVTADGRTLLLAVARSRRGGGRSQLDRRDAGGRPGRGLNASTRRRGERRATFPSPHPR